MNAYDADESLMLKVAVAFASFLVIGAVAFSGLVAHFIYG